MSSQWRHVSGGHWEITQSNPPSELLNDPIVSTSSNPDERSSSPAMTEVAQDFSHAAQAETEPIPVSSNNPSRDTEGMMVLSSSPRRSVNETVITESTSEAVSNIEDPNDPDFEVHQSDNSENTTNKQRAKKRAPRSSKRATTGNKPIPASKPVVPLGRKAKPSLSTKRLPKKSFYSILDHNAKSRSGPNTKAANKQNSGSRGHVRPASPIETVDYDNDDDDFWYPPNSPGKQQPEVKVESQSTHATVDPANSKKKRSQDRSGVKPKITKKSTTRSEQKPLKSNKGTSSHESVHQDVQRRKSPRLSKPSQHKDQKSILSENGASRMPNSADTLARTEEEQGESARPEPTYIDLTAPSAPTTVVSEEDLQEYPAENLPNRDEGKNVDQPRGPIVIQEQTSLNKAGSRKQQDVPSAQFTRRSMVSESGSPLESSNVPTGNIAAGGHSPHEEQYIHPENHQGLFAPNPLQASSDVGPSLLQTGSEESHARGTMKPGVTRSRGGRKSIPNRTSRITMSSSTNGDVVGHANDFVSPAPQLHPKSVDFARRVVQEQNEMEYYEGDEQEPIERRQYQSANRFSWSQPRSSVKRRSDPEPALSRGAGLTSSSGAYPSSGGHGRPSNPSSGSAFEAKWKDAVDAASGGAVDVLHLISTNLLEYLRSREQSVFAVVHEYKRNGTKVYKRVATHQAGELLDASRTTKQKCSELVKFYGELSSETQDFRARYLSKQHNQAYAEWQRQTTEVKGAIRAAREVAILS